MPKQILWKYLLLYFVVYVSQGVVYFFFNNFIGVNRKTLQGRSDFMAAQLPQCPNNHLKNPRAFNRPGGLREECYYILEVAFEQSGKSSSMAGFVFAHFMYGIVDGIVI